jgi:hypothetical protein
MSGTVDEHHQHGRVKQLSRKTKIGVVTSGVADCGN